MLNLANKITLLRIFIVPVVVLLLYFEGPVTCFFASLAFVIASLTDWLDGYIARHGNMVTSLGKFLDPMADKLLVCSACIMLTHLAWLPAWLVIVIVCRELAVTGLRAIARDEGIVLAADVFGKAKTALQVLALAPLILHYPIFTIDLLPIAMILLYISSFLAVFSAVNYFYTFCKESRNA